MSFFNKVLASIGVGAATVDTKLAQSTYAAGEIVSGNVEVTGGNVAQQIDTIYLTVNTTYIREVDDNKYTDTAVIEKVKVTDPFTIEPNEKKVIPFSFELPRETPMTIGKTRVWIHTGLDIKSAIDPTDKDFIDVKPSQLATHVLTAIDELGFRLREAECKQASSYLRGRHPFIQEFEFVPSSGPYRGHLDELEVSFLSQSEQSAELLIQVDRKAKGLGGFLAEALDMDETHVRVTITTLDVPNLKDKLQQVISKYI